jgi:hypothetical protein
VSAWIVIATLVCDQRSPDTAAVTRSSLEALEDGHAKFFAGNFSGAREAFAATAGGP